MSIDIKKTAELNMVIDDPILVNFFENNNEQKVISTMKKAIISYKDDIDIEEVNGYNRLSNVGQILLGNSRVKGTFPMSSSFMLIALKQYLVKNQLN